MKVLKYALALTITLAITSTVHAKSASQEFRELTYALAEGQLDMQVEILPAEQINKKVLTKLLKIANKEAQIWYDTILEGDYQLSPSQDLTLDEVALVTVSGKAVAYRIKYSHAAWDVANCDYQDDLTAENELTIMQGCVFGKIVGTSYVNLKMTQAERDHNNSEEFLD